MKKQLSRRDFLKIAAAGVGAATLGACTPETATPTEVAEEATEAAVATEAPAPTEAPIVEVDVTTSGWPLAPVSEEEAAADVTKKSLRDIMQVWFDNNPGVTLTSVAVNIWDPQGVPAMIAAGTAPAWIYGPCAGGGWGRTEAINAFVQGLLADISPAVASHGLEAKCKPNIWAAWSAGSTVEDKFFSYPLNEYSPSSDQMMFRKDLINQKGLQMPYLGWSFAEYKEILKGLTDPDNGFYGAAHPTWWLGYTCSMHGWDILTNIPQPDQPWHNTRDLSDPRWAQIISSYREMLFTDKSVFTDVALGAGDTEHQALFKNGQCAFARGNFWSFVQAPTDPTSLAAMADRLGQSYEDTFGVAMLPVGDGYQKGGGVDLWGPVSYPAGIDENVVDKGCGLIDWFFFDDGLDMGRKANWDATQDPRLVFGSFLYMDGREGQIFEGVPATPADAWGESLVNTFIGMADKGFEPPANKFYPGEVNPAPSGQAIDDQLSLMATDPSDLDVAAILAQAQADYVAQLPGFSSSISSEDYKAAAQNYYAAMDEFLKTNDPVFYENRFKPFYEAKVLPAIS